MLCAPRVPCADPEARALRIDALTRCHQQSIQFSSRAELTVILRLTQYRKLCTPVLRSCSVSSCAQKCPRKWQALGASANEFWTRRGLLRFERKQSGGS